MTADQMARAVPHRRNIERGPDPPGATFIDGERAASVDDAIEIMPACRAESSVKILSRSLCRKDGDRQRLQMIIDPVA